MKSKVCTLFQPKPQSDKYQCRPAAPPCERGFAQSGFVGSGAAIPKAKAQIAECEARDGCRFQPGSCYCHCRGYGKTEVEDGEEAEGCNCACSGGSPQSCVAEGPKD